jgi:hypothetical protein
MPYRFCNDTRVGLKYLVMVLFNLMFLDSRLRGNDR